MIWTLQHANCIAKMSHFLPSFHWLSLGYVRTAQVYILHRGPRIAGCLLDIGTAVIFSRPLYRLGRKLSGKWSPEGPLFTVSNCNSISQTTHEIWHKRIFLVSFVSQGTVSWNLPWPHCRSWLKLPRLISPVQNNAQKWGGYQKKPRDSTNPRLCRFWLTFG